MSADEASSPSALAPGSPVRRWVPWVALAVVVVTCLSVAAFGSRSAPTAQDRVNDIARTVKCPQCSGESVLESNAPSAREIKVESATQVQQGRSDEEIRTYFASRYDDILLTPPASGISLVVWVLPVVALAVGVAALVIAFRRWGGESGPSATDADRARVAEALAREHEAAADPHGEGASR